MNNLLLKAILALDSYNRGYDQALIMLDADGSVPSDSIGERIGTAIITNESDIGENTSGVNYGFYASGYDTNSDGIADVISYRGVDNATLDARYGWGVAVGFPHERQALLAFEFYREVAGSIDPRTANISLTGHSMGAGLAGLVGAAYTKEGLLFDNMAFTNAANNLSDYATLGGNYSPDLHRIAYNNTTPWDVNFSGLTGLYIKGESLGQGYTPGNHKFQSIAETEFTLGYAANDLSDRQKHSMASLVMVMYGEDISNKSWKAASQYLWPVLYRDAFAESIGFDEDNFQGSDIVDTNYSSVLRQVLAYSAIDDGVLVFGNSGIASLFDDANDLGFSLSRNLAAPTNIANHADDIVQIFTQYAGNLALNHIIKEQQPTVLNGVVSITDTADEKVLTIDLSKERWNSTEGEIFGRTSLIERALNDTQSSMEIKQAISKLWRDDYSNTFERVIFGLNESNSFSLGGVPWDYRNALIYGGAGADTFSSATVGNDLLLGGAGFDSFATGLSNMGNDIFDGGSGIDTLYILGASYAKYGHYIQVGGIVESYSPSDFHYALNIEKFELRSLSSFLIKEMGHSYYGVQNNYWVQTTLDYSEYGSGITVDLWAGNITDETGNVDKVRLRDSNQIEISHAHDFSVTGTNHGDTYKLFQTQRSSSDIFSSTIIISGTGDDIYEWNGSLVVFSGGNDFVKEDAGASNFVIPANVGLSSITAAVVNLDLMEGRENQYEGDIKVSIAGYGSITFENSFSYSYSPEGNRYYYYRPLPQNYPTIYLQTSEGLAKAIIASEFAGMTKNNFSLNIAVNTDMPIATRVYQGSSSNDFFDFKTVVSFKGTIYGEYYGYGGNDIIVTDNRINTIYAGLGIDKVIFSLNFSNYDFTFLNDRLDVISDQGGRAIIYSAEIFEFKDKIVTFDEMLSYISLTEGTGEDDILQGSAGGDILDGWAGEDIYIINHISDVIVEYAFNENDIDTAKSSVTYTLPEYVENLVLTGSSQINGTGNNLKNSIIGNSNANTIDSGAGNDIVDGGGGNDILNGGTGIDTLSYASAGSGVNINLSITSAQNTISSGTDTVQNFENLFGSNFSDTLTGNSSNNSLEGGLGNDTLNGAAGNDTYVINLDNGSDTIIDASGNDKIVMGAGMYQSVIGFLRSSNDLLINYAGEQVARVVGHYTGTGAIETLQFFNGSIINLKTLSLPNSSINGTSGNDVLNGTSSSDVLNGLAGNDVLNGNSGDDTLDGGLGIDSLNGGAGNDTYNIILSSGLDTISDSSGTDKIVMGAGITATNASYARVGSDLIVSVSGTQAARIVNHYSGTTAVETLQFSNGTTVNLQTVSTSINGTAGNDTVNGTTGNDLINGLAGNDILNGNGGNDIFDGGTGTDTINGAAGNDTYNIALNSGLDTITDTSGTEKIIFGAGLNRSAMTLSRDGVNKNDLNILFSGVKIAVVKNHFSGTGNVETLQFSDGTTYNLLTHAFAFNGTSSSETLKGHIGVDVINGGTGNDILYGGGGNDTLSGQAGNDTLRGETGNDLYVYDGGLDKIYETGGTDILKLAATMKADSLVFSDVGTVDTKMTFATGTHDITLYGQRGTNANLKVETVQFADGFTANLATYKTWIWGSTAAQSTNGTANADTILGRAGNDNINGNAGNDALHGGSGNDIVRGGDGNDLINGGIANDTLYGDAGNDVIYGDDGLDTLYGGTGADSFMFLKETAYKNIDVISDFKKTDLDKINIADLLQGYDPLTKAITDYVQITTSGANSILRVDADGGANAFVQIATINGVTGLTDEQSLVNSGHLVVI